MPQTPNQESNPKQIAQFSAITCFSSIKQKKLCKLALRNLFVEIELKRVKE
jgi:hypothetical protein